MRFDPERVVAHAGGAVAPVASTSVDLDRAADEFVDRIAAIGWRIERVPASRTSAPLVPIIVLLTGWYWVELRRVEPTLWPVAGLVVAGLLVASFGYGFIVALRRGTSGPDQVPPLPPRHVLATDRRGEPRPARLLLFARLAEPGPTWSRRGLVTFFLVLMLPGAVLLIPWKPDVFRVHHWAAWGILIAQGLGMWLVTLNLLMPGRVRDRTGLPMLVELARSWPKGASDRVETWVIATPAVNDLAWELGRRFNDGTPTLAVALDSPGIGPDLTLFGRGEAADLASEAASALWVPHRRARRIPAGVGHHGFRGNGIPCVSLCGSDDDRPVDPAALARVAQLVTEIAFRWGKRAAQVAQEPDASRARSSQNPG